MRHRPPTHDSVLLDAAAMLRHAARRLTDAARDTEPALRRRWLRAAQTNLDAAQARLASYDTEEPAQAAPQAVLGCPDCQGARLNRWLPCPACGSERGAVEVTR